MLPLQALEMNTFLIPSNFWQLLAFLVLHHSILCICGHIPSSFLCFKSHYAVSHKDITVAFNLSISKIVTSAKQFVFFFFFLLSNLQGNLRTTISRGHFQFTQVASQNSAYQFPLLRKLCISFKLLQDYLYFYYITEYNINYML